MIIFFSMLFIRLGKDEESGRAAAAASCPGQRYAKSFFSSFFILFCEREGSAADAAMVALCVFITLKPGSRKAEEEDGKKKKRENILPN